MAMGYTNDSSAKPAIVIATKTAKCLPVLFASIDQYVPLDVTVIISGSDLELPRHQTINLPNNGTNYGDSYNDAVQYAFAMFPEIIVANDDIVLTPSTYSKLMEDVVLLKNNKLGWVCSRSDYVRGLQNIREGSKRNGVRHIEEDTVIKYDVLSPLFGWISREAWVDYKPINWYSDDIQCLEIRANGFVNYISRSYVHHVGSQTIGMDHEKNDLEAQAWIKIFMPELYDIWFKSK
jgi:hypothetical protein